MFENFNPNDNQFTMTLEEQKKHKGVFSRLCLAFLLFIGVSQLVGTAIAYAFAYTNPDILKDPNFSIILSSVSQYIFAFPIFFLFVKKIPTVALPKKELKLKEFIKLAAVCVFIMQVGNSLSSITLSLIEESIGILPTNDTSDLILQSNIILSAVVVGIIGPVVEELIFRKIAIDRLMPYGEKIAVFFPALIFGLIHGNLYQFFNAFFLGVIFSFVYVKTGNIIYPIILHCFINMFFAVLPSYAISNLDWEEFWQRTLENNFTMEYIEQNEAPLTVLSICGIIMMVMFVLGMFTFNRNLYRIKFNKGEILLPQSKSAEIMFFNAGAIVLIVVCVIITVFNTFYVAAA